MNASDYRFKCDVRLIVLDDDSVELRVGVWNTTSTVLTDRDKKGVLAKLLLGLWDGCADGKRFSELNVAESDISGVITNLLQAGYLIPKERVSTFSNRPYLCSATDYAIRENQPIPERVNLIAPEDFSRLFSSVIPQSDREKITLVGSADINKLYSEDFFRGDDAVGRIDDIIQFDAWKDSLVCVISADFHPILLSNINQLAHRVKFTSLSAVVDGPFLLLGPTIFPGNTPCFRCTEIRILDMMRDHTVYMRFKESLARQRERRFESGELNPFQATLVSLAAWECLSLISTGTSFTTSKLLTVYGPSMEFAFNEIVNVPNCEVCGNKPGLDIPLYSDLQAFISEHY